MNIKSAGYIFLTTLLTVMVISLLVLTCLQHVLMYHKSVNKIEVQHQNFYQLERIAIQLARAKPSDLNENCLHSDDDANHVIHQLTHSEGCSLAVGLLKYRYFIEELGDYSCLIAQSNHTNYSTHHRRVSLMFLGDESQNSLLQIRYIMPIRAQACLGTEHHVSLGISSWRYFASI